MLHHYFITLFIAAGFAKAGNSSEDGSSSEAISSSEFVPSGKAASFGKAGNSSEDGSSSEDASFAKAENSAKGGGSKEGSCNKCGVANGGKKKRKVIKGKPVDPENKYPWIVAVKTQVKGNMWKGCTGAILSPHFVMTAAHCVYKISDDSCMGKDRKIDKCVLEVNRVYLFGDKKSDNDFYKVKKVIVHPDFWAKKYSHGGSGTGIPQRSDIALVEVEKALPCDEQAMPICLPTKQMDFKKEKLIVAGLGATSSNGGNNKYPKSPMEGEVHETDKKKCHNPEAKDDEIFCVTGEKTGQIPCKGDSGSSMFAKVDGAFTSIAVDSLGTIGCDPKATNLAVNVFAYMDWIKKEVKDLPKQEKSKSALI